MSAAQIGRSVQNAESNAGKRLLERNQGLATMGAEQRLDWAFRELPAAHVVSTSFGAQSAALLHMITLRAPNIPVVFIDTGFLFPETYAFANELRERLKLNVFTVRARPDRQWKEAEVAALHAGDHAAIARYNDIHKVEPMQRALRELKAETWIAGLRRTQSDSRATTPFLAQVDGRFKLHPLADWSDRDIGRYLTKHQLPYHPLWEQGYVSIGDRYLTTPMLPGMLAEQTRFFGIKRECGLHEPSQSEKV